MQEFKYSPPVCNRREVENGTIDVLDDGIGHYPQWEDSENVAKLYIEFVVSVL